MKNVETLIGLANIVPKLDDDLLGQIAEDVNTGYEIDIESRYQWEQKNKVSIELAEQIWEQKDYPYKNAANVKYPLIATASIQFAARAYPEFVKNPDVVKCKVVGQDPNGMKAARAERVGQHMSWQCLNEMDEWEQETDKLLTYLPIVGTGFKKTYFSSVLGRNVSEFRRANDLVINYWAKSMERAPRMTDVIVLYPNEIEERIRSGLFVNFDYGRPTSSESEDRDIATNDPDQPHVFLEQHTFYDLDNDGYKEPYIITFHKDTKKVVRIVARFRNVEYKNNKISRIPAVQYFTKFPFMPSISGSIYDSGFGGLLGPINSTINTTVNQLLDSGHLYTLNAGFLGKGIQLGRGRGGGALEFAPGEWKQLLFTGDDLRKHIYPLPVKEPSMVLYNLLGFMISAGERLSSVTEILTGDQSNEAERPTTTLARIEQGLKVFSSIHKRLFRAFKEEFKKLYELNRQYLQPLSYFTVLDDQRAIPKEDYDGGDLDIIPVADPNETTNTQKLIRGQIWMSMKGQGFNDMEINKRFAEAMQEPEPEKLLNAEPPPPDPKIVLEGEKLKMEADKFQFDMIKWQAEGDERQAKVMNLIAKAEQAVANAEAQEVGQQLDLYKAHLTALTEEFKVRYGNNTGSVGKVDGGSSNS